jgi:hypothetical protein
MDCNTDTPMLSQIYSIMITHDNKLVYGSLTDDNIHISEKFDAVQKIICCNNKYYILNSDGTLYVNNTITNDNFKLIDCVTKFIDIEKAFLQVYAVGTDNKLYIVNSDDTIKIFDKIQCQCNFAITNIYSSSYYLVLKSDTCDYYLVTRYGRIVKYLGNFDRIYFSSENIITVKNNDIQLINNYNSRYPPLYLISALSNNIVALCEIPEGSTILLYNIRTDEDTINLTQTVGATTIDSNIRIMTVSYFYFRTVCVCHTTKNIYVSKDHVHTNKISCLQGYTFNKISRNTDKYKRTKNANNNNCT